MPNKVRFIETVKSKYLSLQSPDSNSLYFITDTQEIYKGDQSLSPSMVTTYEAPPLLNTLEEWKNYIKSFLTVIPISTTSCAVPSEMQYVTVYPEGGSSVVKLTTGTVNAVIRMFVSREDSEIFAIMLLTSGELEVTFDISSDSFKSSNWNPTAPQWTEL